MSFNTKPNTTNKTNTPIGVNEQFTSWGMNKNQTPYNNPSFTKQEDPKKSKSYYFLLNLRSKCQQTFSTQWYSSLLLYSLSLKVGKTTMMKSPLSQAAQIHLKHRIQAQIIHQQIRRQLKVSTHFQMSQHLKVQIKHTILKSSP